MWRASLGAICAKAPAVAGSLKATYDMETWRKYTDTTTKKV